MIEFDFKRPTRRCSQTENEIGPGDVFYSALIEGGDGELVRKDYAAEVWQGPPEDCIGWWRSRIPTLDKGRIYWAPRGVLMAFFEHAYEQSQQTGLAYVMALLLVRKRILSWQESLERDGKRWLVVHDAKAKQAYEVEQFELTEEQMQAIQQNLADKLFTDQQVADEDEGVADVQE
jgi:hypothetical protein